jgi:predicted TIM-barrel fold metal-dependent hydrolase
MILDAHVHCGNTLKFINIYNEWKRAGIAGGVMFPPVEEIYDRYNQAFTDSSFYRESRKKVHEYLYEIADQNENIYIYFFVWNDFEKPWKGFSGIKWHRHSNEPHYEYSSEKCKKLIEHVKSNGIPVLIEEEFSNTIDFLKSINGKAPVVIPHLGFLNGGYLKLKSEGIFQESNVFADTALADYHEIEDFVSNFGAEKLFFGSDYPFGSPYHELSKVREIFSNELFVQITRENILKLLG